MLNDLSGTYLNPGTPKEAVLELLGPPAETSEDYFSYLIGGRTRYAFNDEFYLDIDFDKNGNIERVSRREVVD